MAEWASGGKAITRPIDGIVLIGPPGSGKSFLGRLLHERGSAHFVDLEPLLIDRFGTGQSFAANKLEALRFIEENLEQQLTDSSKPVIVESTGFSDRELLLRSSAVHRLLFARLNTPKDVCVARVAARQPGSNLNNDTAFTASFYDFWKSEIEPTWIFDLDLDGQDADASMEVLAAMLDLA